ncbi:MAG: hypothetical protein ABL883_15385 [Terricaulis sp.]
MSQHSTYRHLRADRIIATLEKLSARIGERFPDAGLAQVCAELVGSSRTLSSEAAALARPSLAWPLAGIILVSTIAALLFTGLRYLKLDGEWASPTEVIQGLEAAVNLLILVGGAIWFVLTLEERAKRRRALDALHQLRALAHVIDMHQLTKDPTVVLNAHKTANSPERTMTRFELTRYLEYCAEMQALVGKLAALFADRMRDAVVINAVNDIEDLTTGLGRKIWQKITIISDLEEG